MSHSAPKMNASSTTSTSEGQGSGLPQKEHGGKHYDRAAVTDGVLDKDLLWVVKSPFRVRRSETVEKRGRGSGDINVKVRLLAADTAKREKPRAPESAKRPSRRAEGASHFKVYQVQRRGEPSTKLVTGRTITQKFNSLCQQSLNRAGGEFRRNGAPQEIKDEKTPSYSRVFPQVRPIPTGPKPAEREAQICNAPLTTPPGGQATGERAVIEESEGEKQCKTYGSVPNLVRSPFTALLSLSEPVLTGSVEGNQLQGHLPKSRFAAPCGDASGNTRWTAQDISQDASAAIPHPVPSTAQQDSHSPTCEQKNASSSLQALRYLQHTASRQIAGLSDDFLNVQKLCYWQPSRESELVSPALTRVQSSKPPACANGYAPGQLSDTTGDFQPSLVRFAGPATDFTETCGKWCDPESGAEEKRNGSEKHPDISGQTTVESSHPSEGEHFNGAPQQGGIMQRVFKFGSASSAGPCVDNAQPSVSRAGPIQGERDAPQTDRQQPSFLQKLFAFGKAPFIKHAEETESTTATKQAPEDVSADVQKALSKRKLPEELSQSWKSTSSPKEYAVFLPRRLRHEELGKQDEVAVIFRMLHHRKPKPSPVSRRAALLPLSTVAPTQPRVSKEVFHFRVLQQQQPRDDEKRRLVAFKAPTHCRPARAGSYSSKVHLQAAGSAEWSGFCASPCSERARRRHSASSTSSLVTLQYSHRRSYVQLPRAPVSEPQRVSDEFPGKVSVSPFAARVAQETMQRVARRRAAQRAKAHAESADKKETEDSPKVLSRPGVAENGGACTDVSWCCPVRDECEAPQTSPAEGDETAAHSPAGGGSDSETERTSSYRESGTESGTSAGASDAEQVQTTEESISATQSGHLCKQLGDWLRCGWKADTSKEPQTEMSSSQCGDAVQYVCGFHESEDQSSDDGSRQQHTVSLSPCCEPRTPTESILPEDSSVLGNTPATYPSPDAGPVPVLAPSTETMEGMQSPWQETNYPRATSGIVTPPLYTLPVVSFLPPVFEPLPVVETVAIHTPIQLPTCYFAVPSSPSNVCDQEAAGGQDNASVVNSSFAETSTLPKRVKICILPNRGFIAHS